MKHFAGRTAVVTGAASGIGYALSKRFAAEGMSVVMADVEQVALERSANLISESGGRVLAHRTDVSKPDSVAALASAAKEAFGKVHVLCANAGVVRIGSAWDQSLDDWNWVIDVNLWGPVHCVRSFIPAMLQHGEEGHVVVTASAVGLAADSSSSYCASKFAAVGLAEGLAKDLMGTPIGVSVLCPGGVKTQIYQAERNRPRDKAIEGVMSPEVARRWDALAAPMRTDQAPPEAIADLVMQAIAAKQMYIVPMQAPFNEEIRRRLSELEQALEAAPSWTALTGS